MQHSPEQPTIDRRLPVAELPQYLTVDELMRNMSVGRTSAYAFAREHGVRIGRLVRVPREALSR